MRTKIIIRPDGTAAGILPEDFDTSEIGKRRVHRLSHVVWIDQDQSWVIYDETTNRWLDRKKFKTRDKAIAYERWYMERKFKKVLKFAGVK